MQNKNIKNPDLNKVGVFDILLKEAETGAGGGEPFASYLRVKNYVFGRKMCGDDRVETVPSSPLEEREIV